MTLTRPNKKIIKLYLYSLSLSCSNNVGIFAHLAKIHKSTWIMRRWNTFNTLEVCVSVRENDFYIFIVMKLKIQAHEFHDKREISSPGGNTMALRLIVEWMFARAVFVHFNFIYSKERTQNKLSGERNKQENQK